MRTRRELAEAACNAAEQGTPMTVTPEEYHDLLKIGSVEWDSYVMGRLPFEKFGTTVTVKVARCPFCGGRGVVACLVHDMGCEDNCPACVEDDPKRREQLVEAGLGPDPEEGQ